MLTNLLKRIWNDRASNGWLFAELFIVFVILWYVIDFLFATLYCSHEPKGYDTRHVYHVSVGINPTIQNDYMGKEEWTDTYLQVYRLIKEYPGVESACYYAGTIPYEVGGIFQSYSTDSLHTYRAFIRMVNKEFFDVFKVDMLEGSLNDWSIADYPRPAVLSVDLADSLFHGTQKPGASFFDYYAPVKQYKIGAITPRTKKTEYERYEPFIYVPTEDWMLQYISPSIAIRVKPEVEKGFVDCFMLDMRDKLNIGPFFFSQIRSYDEVKEIHDTDINNYIRTSVAVLLFFIFNVFLGIAGTFWFRTRKRKGETGLRIAIGASRKNISGELLLESICILVISVIPGIIICFNICFLDLTVNTLMDSTGLRFLLGLLITFLLMLIMVIIGVWYPAQRAMAVEPAEALHEE